MSIMVSIIERLEQRMPDVLFLYGKRRQRQNATKHRIVMTRMGGRLTASTAPGGVKVTTLGKSKVLFRRSERVHVLLSSDTEATLDALFDEFVCHVWSEFAPNVFEEPSDYQWTKEDSENGGSHMSSNPKIELVLVFRFQVESKPRLVTVIDSATITADLE